VLIIEEFANVWIENVSVPDRLHGHTRKRRGTCRIDFPAGDWHSFLEHGGELESGCRPKFDWR